MSDLYVVFLNPAFDAEDTDTNDESSYAPLWYLTANQYLTDSYHIGKKHKLSLIIKHITVQSVFTALNTVIIRFFEDTRSQRIVVLYS